MEENEAFASFWGHIDALRHTFLRILLIIISSVILCFVFHEPLISFLTKPFSFAPVGHADIEERLEYLRIHNTEITPRKVVLSNSAMLSSDLSHDVNIDIDSEGRRIYIIESQGTLVYAQTIEKAHELVILSPLEGIMISMKMSLWIGALISSPLWLYVLARFLLPGLHQHERRLILPFVIMSLAFVVTGCLFAYFFTIPLANQYLTAFNGDIGRNLWSLANYLDYTLFLLIANGIAFEMGVIGIFAVQLQLISAEALSENRRYAILGIFILATVLTPPDVLTQLMLAIPLIGLYEALIIYARLRKKLIGAKVQ